MTITRDSLRDWAQAVIGRHQRAHPLSNERRFYGLWYNSIYGNLVGWSFCKKCGLERPTGQLVYRKCANCWIEIGKEQRATQEGQQTK